MAVELSGTDPTLPPLRRLSWAWRYAAAGIVSLLTWSSVVQAQWRDARWMCWLDVSLGAAAFVAYRYHRRWTVAVSFVTIVLSAFSAVAAGPSVLAFVSVATRRRVREIVGLAVLSVGGGLLYTYVTPGSDEWYVDAIFAVLGTGISVAIGMYIGARRELVATLRDRADRAEGEQAMRVAQARANERSRIAREMHDVLAHRISLVSMHAGALAYREDLSPAETRRTADVIRQNAHEALIDLRQILGVLRDVDGPGRAERPQPTLRDLEALIADECRAGARIRLASSVSLEDVPDSIGRNAFRVVQESLTNARKHAPDATVDVRVDGELGGTLRLEVRNPVRFGAPDGPVPGAGLGLIGLAERAHLSGGGLEHSTRRGHFVLQAWLPWPA